MPALSGEPWRGLAKVQLRDALGLGRYWTLSVTDVDPVTATGDQASWDFEGDSVAVTLRVEWGLDSGTTIGAPDTINVQTRIPGSATSYGATVWSFNPSGDSGSATRTLHFDTDPLDEVLGSVANRRHGLLELWLQVIDNPGGSTNDYTLDSRGNATVGPPLTTTYSWGRGYIRQRATLSTHSISNVSLGGAEPTPVWQALDQIHVRVATTTPPLNLSPGFGTIRLRRPQAQGGAAERDATASAITESTPNYEKSMTDSTAGTPLDNVVGVGMFVGSEAKDLEVVTPSGTFDSDVLIAFATSGHPAGWSIIDERTARYVGRITVDPRVTFISHLLQLDDSTYGTPPMSKNVSPAVRRDVQFGFLSERASAARSGGIGGITWTSKLWDTGELSGTEASPVASRSATSGVVGGEDGWAATLLGWDEDKPGGSWTKKAIITAPGAAIGMEIDNSTTLTLLVKDSRIHLNIAAGDPTTPGTHWRPGSQLTIGARLFKEYAPVSADASTGKCAILRFDPATGRIQYLQSVSPAVWSYLVNDSNVSTFAMSASPGDADLHLKTFTASQTSDFDTRDLFILASLDKDGVSYDAFSTNEAVDVNFPHSGAAAGSIPEAAILFGDAGHQHTGGTDGRAIGDRS